MRGYVEEKPELVYVTGNRKFPSTVEAIKSERARQEYEIVQNPESYLQRISNLRTRLQVNPNLSLSNRLKQLQNIFQLACKEHGIDRKNI